MSDAVPYIDMDDDRWRLTPRALRDHVRKLQEALAAADSDFANRRAEAVQAVTR